MTDFVYTLNGNTVVETRRHININHYWQIEFKVSMNWSVWPYCSTDIITFCAVIYQRTFKSMYKYRYPWKYLVKIEWESIITWIFLTQQHNKIWFHGCSNSGYAVTHSLDRNNYIVATCKRHLLAYDVQYKLFCITWYYASKTDSTQRAQTIKMDRTIR